MKKSNVLGEYLKEKRIASGLAQADVSEKLGYSTPQFISNWERGVSAPPINVLKKIGVMYGILAEDLFEIALAQKVEEITLDLKRKFKR